MVAIGISGLLGGRLFEGAALPIADNISVFANPVLTLAVFVFGVDPAFAFVVGFLATGFFAVAFGFAVVFLVGFGFTAFFVVFFVVVRPLVCFVFAMIFSFLIIYFNEQ